jgi:hypothetical protein
MSYGSAEKRGQPVATANGPKRPWLISNVRQRMTPADSLLPAAFLLVDKNGEPLRPFDAPDDFIFLDFFTPGLLLTAGAIAYALAVAVARRKKKQPPFSYTYWLVLGSGLGMLMVPFVSLAIRSTLDFFHH